MIGSFLLGAVLYAVCVKLAGRVVRQTRFTWSTAAGFGAASSLIANVFTQLRGTAPDVAIVAAGVPLLLGLGTWIISAHATDSDERPISKLRALAVSAVAVAFTFLFAAFIGVALLSVMSPR